MLISCWSAKGGVGVSTVAAALALSASSGPGPVRLVDLSGDQPSCLGIDPPDGPGVADWLAAGPDVPADALARLAVPIGSGLELIPRGVGALEPARASLLVQVLASWGGTVVVDGGRPDLCPVAACVAAEAHHSYLVARMCPVGLSRIRLLPVRPTGVVVVREIGRGLNATDVANAAGAPVVVDLVADRLVGRAVDVGLVHGRLPRSFSRAIDAVVA